MPDEPVLARRLRLFLRRGRFRLAALGSSGSASGSSSGSGSGIVSVGSGGIGGGSNDGGVGGGSEALAMRQLMRDRMQMSKMHRGGVETLIFECYPKHDLHIA